MKRKNPAPSSLKYAVDRSTLTRQQDVSLASNTCITHKHSRCRMEVPLPGNLRCFNFLLESTRDGENLVPWLPSCVPGMDCVHEAPEKARCQHSTGLWTQRTYYLTFRPGSWPKTALVHLNTL